VVGEELPVVAGGLGDAESADGSVAARTARAAGSERTTMQTAVISQGRGRVLNPILNIVR